MENKKYEIKDVDDDERIIRILASDESLDRDGDIIRAKGWITDNFIKSGSIIYGHNASQLPVARPLSAEVVGRKLYVNAQFPEKGTSEFNDAVYNLIKQKILRGVSVGFRAQEWDDIETGREYKKQELLELSVTPIPANPNAMLQVKEYSDEVKNKLLDEAIIVKEGAEEEETNVEPVEAKPQQVAESEVDNTELAEKLQHIADSLSRLQ